ncbi:MAG: hypothetical protein JO247_14915 [Chloroflexi bacterium]|nr:hypothetical protein [Chloroflexota bacterium]
MAVATAPGTVNAEALAEDVSNIVMMEHVNVQVPDQAQATLFYIVGLGFTRDPYMNVGLTNIWVNIGDQQFHLPTGKPQVVRGHTGLVVRDLDALKQRLASIQDQLKGTQFSWADKGDHVEATSPWGNRFKLYGPGQFGNMRIGLPYVEFTVPKGSAAAIQRFYDEVFDAPGTVEKGAATIEVGSNQCLVFHEADEVPDYDGHHVAVYVQNFSKPFAYLEERGLLTEGIRNHQFRFQDIVDTKTGKPVFTIEHEVRSTRHPLYRRQLVNREPENPPMQMVGRASAPSNGRR